jgi:hypothetical protein
VALSSKNNYLKMKLTCGYGIRHESTVELRLRAYQVPDKNLYTVRVTSQTCNLQHRAVGREVPQKEKVHTTVPWSRGKGGGGGTEREGAHHSSLEHSEGGGGRSTGTNP